MRVRATLTFALWACAFAVMGSRAAMATRRTACGITYGDVVANRVTATARVDEPTLGRVTVTDALLNPYDTIDVRDKNVIWSGTGIIITGTVHGVDGQRLRIVSFQVGGTVTVNNAASANQGFFNEAAKNNDITGDGVEYVMYGGQWYQMGSVALAQRILGTAYKITVTDNTDGTVSLTQPQLPYLMLSKDSAQN